MRLTTRVHHALSRHVRPGDTAIDATAGNGHDTLCLAGLAGPGGTVHAFDIRPEAVAATRRRLEAAGLADACALVFGDHAAEMEKRLPELAGRTAAAVFNLGFLPGSDHAAPTRPETTLAALGHAEKLLRPGGLLAVTAYRGHPGGAEEARAVREWMLRAASRGWRVIAHRPAGRPSAPAPVLWLARKSATARGTYPHPAPEFHATQSA